MTSRTSALVSTLIAAGLLLWKGPGTAELGMGLMGALFVLAAAYLVAGVARTILAGLGVLIWIATLVVSVRGPAGLVTLAGVFGLAAALQVVVFGRRWPGWSSKYDRTPARVDDPRSMWESLDRGEDPTAGP